MHLFHIFIFSPQTLRININYQVIDGSLQYANKTPIHINASLVLNIFVMAYDFIYFFQNRIETVDVFLNNKFNAPVNVLRMEFQTHESCFTFTWPDPSTSRLKLQSNRTQRVRRIHMFKSKSLMMSLSSVNFVSTWHRYVKLFRLNRLFTVV